MNANLPQVLTKRSVDLVILVLVLLALSISVLVRPSPQYAVIDTQSEAINLTLQGPFLLQGNYDLKPGSLLPGKTENILINNTPASGNDLVKILSTTHPSLNLQEISLAPGSSLSLLKSSGLCAALGVRRGRGGIVVDVGGSNVRFAIPASASGASDLTICPTQPLSLAFFGLREIDFGHVYRPNYVDSFSMSTLSTAKLAFPKLDLSRDVIALAGLRVSGVNAAKPVIIGISADSNLRLQLATDVSEIDEAPYVHPHSLLPLLLEHCTGGSPITRLLTGFSLFWGFAWGIFRFARPKGDASP